MLERTPIALNIAQREDALVLLRSLTDACTPLSQLIETESSHETQGM